MTRTILFLGADAGGNVPPMYAVAQTLAARGHRIVYAGLTPPDPAWEYDLLPAVEGYAPGTATSGREQLAGLLRMGMSGALARQAAAVIARRSPDVIVVDGVMNTSIRSAERTGIPVAVLFHSLGAFWAGPLSRVSGVLGVFALSPRTLWRAADARLLMTDPVLDPLKADADPIGFEWTGTCEVGAEPAPRGETDPPLVVVSLSSAWQKDQDAVYGRIIDALGTLPVRVIVTRAAPPEPFVGEVPPNVEVRGRSAHAQILPLADLVIGHGGHSTTLRALAHGIPLLVIPLNATSDQPLIGRTIEAAGVGLTLPRRATSEAIAAAMTRLIADGPFREHAARAGVRLRAQDGASVAADRIEALATR